MATSKRLVRIREDDYSILTRLKREFDLPIIKIHELLLFEEYPVLKKRLQTYKKPKRKRHSKR